ncbi:MAG: hypothetical protein Q9219_002810 [cf. Caloplaca sp. 3 TL-2023]
MTWTLFAILITSIGIHEQVNAFSLPIIDLGYSLHQASIFDTTGRTYNFSNIRYAEPPTGDLRFRAPLPPQTVNRSVDDGSIGRVCAQAIPAWEAIAAQFVPAYLTGQPFNVSDAEAALDAAASSEPFIDPRTTEDCLFLDVVVPEQILSKASNSSSSKQGAPVLVWIHGGGYTLGEKTGDGVYNPAGLIKASQVSGAEGVVYVAINYRLGAFGWLAGPTLQSDGTANAGLYDQRLALEWVQRYIHLFGGDPNRVTVFGESAGGGSIMHQITAFGGEAGKVPFQQAILQSPAFQNTPGNLQQEQTFGGFLSLLNVSTLQEARQLPSSALIQANAQQVAASPYTLFTYGPAVDGLFAPGLPGKLLLHGSFDHSVKLMLGHNADEGLAFTSPFINNSTAYDNFLRSSLPDISPDVASYIENELYPPPSESTPYKDEVGRASLSTSESSFVCNTLYLDRAFGNETYAYQFSVPPALHGQDVVYTFFNGPNSVVGSGPPVTSDATALALQQYITSFAETGVPGGPGIPRFPLWHQLYAPLLWGNPASNFGTENDRVYVALTRFKRSLKRVRLSIRSLTHTLHLPPAQAEIYDGPHPEWLRDVLVKLPNLQSLVVSQLPFFDHASLVPLRTYGGDAPTDEGVRPSFTLRLLIANQCTNTTQRSLADSLVAFPDLVFLDLSRTLGVRDAAVLSQLRHMHSLQILKLCGIQLRDVDMSILAESIGIRVRSLDVRDNLLTDNSVRTLLHSCFLTTSDANVESSSTRPRGLSGATEEDWPAGILKPDPSVLDEFRDESFDERYLKRLTQGVISRLPSDDQPHSGITHLYIANNRLTVEGVSSLLRSTRLHVLDAGAVDTVRHFHSTSASFSPSSPHFRGNTLDLPGAEKIVPVLAKNASNNLTSIRIDHTVITKSIVFDVEDPERKVCELSSDVHRHEQDSSPPVYELPHEQAERFELPGDSVHMILSPPMGTKPEDQGPTIPLPVKRGSIYAPEAVHHHNESTEDASPILTATGLNTTAQAINGVSSPASDLPAPILELEQADSPPKSPYLSQSILEKQRQDVHSMQFSKPHGLLPSMLPRLRSLTLTDVPFFDHTNQVIDALTDFIRCCASELELAKAQLNLESTELKNQSRRNKKPLRQAVGDIFALRKITLEMSSPQLFGPSHRQSDSPRTPQTTNFPFRSKSSTEDADSEAFWAAQEKDFSFFDDDVECGLPSIEPGLHFPTPTLAEKMVLPTDSTALPTLQQPVKADAGRDVIQELTKFRRERKSAYEAALRRGEKSVEGYWPGEVKVVRNQGGKTAAVDFYGNYFEKGYIYR